MREKIKKCLSILAGIFFAVLFSAPYIIFKEELQNIKLVGYMGLFITCAISNISVMLPSSSTLFVVTAASILNPMYCILCGGLGASLGEQSSYLCGRTGTMGFENEFVYNARIWKWIKQREFATIFIFAFIPLPLFDIAGIAAGALRMNWIKYTFAAILGKMLKFLVAILGIYYIIPNIIDFIPDPGQDILRKMLNQVI